MTHELWANLNVEITRYLASVRLSQLVEYPLDDGAPRPIIMYRHNRIPLSYSGRAEVTGDETFQEK